LDVETLELLEERLIDYPGSLLLVSHDRAFLDNVVTSTLVLEGNGRVGEYVGGYSDWVRQRPTLEESAKPPNRPGNAEARPGSRSGARVAGGHGSKSSAKIGYKEQRELESLPGRIEALETELAQLQAQLADPDFYKKAGSEVAGTRASLARVQSELETSYERWTELEALI
jgi:ATP-binding cassette subfamily F protein uup